MSTPYPIRSHSQQLEAISEDYFRRSLPRGWVCDKPQHDYGVDFRVEVVENDRIRGRELLVQLKASQNGCDGVNEAVRLKVTTYNFLMDKLQLSMLVKYVQAEGEAYWLFLRDIPNPPHDQKTFTVKIPKRNKLSQIDWSVLQNRINSTHDVKLRSARSSA